MQIYAHKASVHAVDQEESLAGKYIGPASSNTTNALQKKILRPQQRWEGRKSFFHVKICEKPVTSLLTC